MTPTDTSPPPGLAPWSRAERHRVVRRLIEDGLPAPSAPPRTSDVPGAVGIALTFTGPGALAGLDAWARRLTIGPAFHAGPWPIGGSWVMTIGRLADVAVLLQAREPARPQSPPPGAPRPAAAPAPERASCWSAPAAPGATPAPDPLVPGREPGMDPLTRDRLIAARHAVRPYMAPTRHRHGRADAELRLAATARASRVLTDAVLGLGKDQLADARPAWGSGWGV